MLVQHFRLKGGSSHRCKSDACPKSDMVWLYRSPIPVRRRGGGNFLVQIFFYLPSLRVGTVHDTSHFRQDMVSEADKAKKQGL